MKVLFKKFSRSSFSMRLVYFFTLLVYTGSYIYLIMNLLKLTGIETTIRIIGIAILGFILFLYLFFGLVLLVGKHPKVVGFLSVILLLISAVGLNGSMAINKVYGLVSNMEQVKTITYTTNLITLKDTEYVNSADFKVGMISNDTDTEGYVLPKELIKNDKLVFTVSEYDTYFEMLELLYKGDLDGIFITSDYVAVYDGYDAYNNIDEDVVVALEYSKEMENQEYMETTGSVDKPFTLLILGVDSTKEKLNPNAGFNGDTIMLVTFNPNTLNATVFSIPRDTYVPIACLKNGGSSKINSSAAYGTNCVINTVQNLTGINIDYYVKINFKGVVNLVDALGGIDLTVPDGIDFCEQDSNRCKKASCKLCIKSGYQHMNGEQALAFARHRKTLATGDFARVQHQQLVVEAIANKAKDIATVNDFYSVLEAVTDNIYTNMSTKEMLNLYNVGKAVLNNNSSDNFGINIQKTYLTGYNLIMYVDNLKLRVYTFQYYEQSLAEIVEAMKINLDLISPTQIKTFNFSVNDTYTQTVIGKKYYTVQRNETIPDFVGNTYEYAKEWLDARSITIKVKYITKGMDGYDDVTYKNGDVISQDVKRGKLVKDISSITLSVMQVDETTNIESTTTTPITNKTEVISTDVSETVTTSVTSQSTSEVTTEITTEKVTEPTTDNTSDNDSPETDENN